jgi:hypothetical protein
MKTGQLCELAVAVLGLSRAVSGWAFVAYDDDLCQTNGREVNVPDGSERCVDGFGQYRSVKPLSTYDDWSAQGRFCGGCNWEGGCDIFWINGGGSGGAQGKWEVGRCLTMRKTYSSVKKDTVS